MADLFLPLIAIALSATSVLVALGAYRLAQRSVPNQVIKTLEGFTDRVRVMEENIQGHDARALAWRTEIDGLIEAAEDVLDRVEKKRRRVQAQETRAKAREDGQAAPQTDAELFAIARQRGLV